MVTKKAEVVALMVIGVVDGGGLASYEGEMRGALFVTGLSLFTLPFIFDFLSSYTFFHLLLSFSLYLFFFQFIFSSLSLSCLERPQNFRFILIPLFLHDYCFTQ
jgi:hypothetical protein